MKTALKYTVVLAFVFLMFTCQSQPDTKNIDKCIKHYYAKLSTNDGSGTYSIDKIKVVEVKKRKNDKVWEVKANVTGTFENGSLPNDEGPRDYKAESTFIFTKSSSKNWQCSIKKEE